MRLEVVAIICSAYPGFCSGLTNIAQHWFLIFIFIKSRAVVSGGRNSNAPPAQSPNVVRQLTDAASEQIEIREKYFLLKTTTKNKVKWDLALHCY